MDNLKRTRIVRDSILGLLRERESDRRYPKVWNRALQEALQSSDFSPLAVPFKRKAFLGPNGDFIIAGPYKQLRNGTESVELSHIVGRVISTPPIPSVKKIKLKLFGSQGEKMAAILPVQIFESSGNLAREHGEGFIVPDNWGWTGSAEGPPVNNMTEQRNRLAKAFRCIERIFDNASAALLKHAVEPLRSGTVVQHYEYQYHDYGHECGLGLFSKINHGLLKENYAMQGIEEWRADGVGLALAIRTQPVKTAARIIASNLITRFGLDSHRGGGLNRDFDMVVALHSLDKLVEGKGLIIKGRKLAFKEITANGLINAVEVLCDEAIRLTRDELNLADPLGLFRRYGQVPVTPHAEALFAGHVVEPCQGIFTNLR